MIGNVPQWAKPAWRLVRQKGKWGSTKMSLQSDNYNN